MELFGGGGESFVIPGLGSMERLKKKGVVGRSMIKSSI
jgi:hypothetical protein